MHRDRTEAATFVDAIWGWARVYYIVVAVLLCMVVGAGLGLAIDKATRPHDQSFRDGYHDGYYDGVGYGRKDEALYEGAQRERNVEMRRKAGALDSVLRAAWEDGYNAGSLAPRERRGEMATKPVRATACSSTATLSPGLSASRCRLIRRRCRRNTEARDGQRIRRERPRGRRGDRSRDRRRISSQAARGREAAERVAMTRRNLDAAIFVWAVAIAATAIWDGIRCVMTDGWQR